MLVVQGERQQARARGDAHDDWHRRRRLDGQREDERDQQTRFRVRIGINLGPVKLVRDINGAPNAIGDGMNAGQRVMSFAAENLRVGGRIVYSTCSIEREENQAIVSAALAANLKLKRAPRAETLMPLVGKLATGVDPAQLFDSDGQFHTLPGAYGTDGFFARVLRRLR